MATCIGCGLTTDGDGKLIAAVSNGAGPLAALDGVAYPCATSQYGGTICDENASGIRVNPDHTTVEAFLAGGPTVGPSGLHSLVGDQEDVATLVNALTITNPSQCRRMRVDVEMSGRLRIDVRRDQFEGNLNSLAINSQTFITFNGGPFQLWRNDTWFKDMDPSDVVTIVGHGQDMNLQPPILAPGAALTIGYRMRATSAGGAEVRLTLNTPSIRVMGHTI